MPLATTTKTSANDLWKPFHLRRRELPADPLDRYLILKSDPFMYMSHCVFTRDQVEADSRRVVKPAPVDRPYLYTLTRLFQAEPLICVWKSRRMWVSWWGIAIMLHEAITKKDRDIYFVSKKEPDANELVLRAKFIYESIPRSIWGEEFLPKAKYIENHLTFPEIRSAIHAVASGEDQLRQFTASGLLLDEFGFWNDCRETYTAARPTAQGGGKILILSSTPKKIGNEDPFMKKIVFDNIE